MMGTYGGHFITYPAFVSYFYRLFGFTSHYICHINTFVAFLSLLILSIFPLKINKTIFGFVLPVVYCIAPIMNVFTTTGLSETFSSFICLSFLFSVAVYNEKKKWHNILFCILCLFMSFLCKRENTCLLIVPFTYVMWNYIENRTIEKKDAFLLVGSFITFIIYIVFIQNIFGIEQIESNDIGTSTFNIQHFIQLFPIFIKSFFSINKFSISIYLLIVSICFIWKKTDYWSLLFITLFGIYLFLYLFHYRGYFFIKYNEVSIFETFRYINNFYYLVPLIVGTMLYKLCKVNCKKWFVIASCIVALAFSAQTTFFLRKELSSIENQNRFQTTKAVCQYIEKEPNAVLITENSLLYLLYSDKDFTVCDVITMEMVDHIFPSKSQFILITDNSINYLQERYATQLDFAYLRPVLSLENATLYRKSSSLTSDNL